MKTIQFIFLLILCVFISCSENEDRSYLVNIQLVFPENYKPINFEEIKVILTNENQGSVYNCFCSATGMASFHVEHGYYTASVYHQTESGIIFSGRTGVLPLLSGNGDNTDTIKLQLSLSETNALVIKEIYFGGCTGRKGEEYQADQYVTLYNNSDQTIYLDGLCISVVDPTGKIESPWMKYTDMKRIPINDITWQFPGTGKNYPLAPNAETTIATNAVNHTGGEYQHSNSVDLSKIDWGFWDASLMGQSITPGVIPMKLLLNLNPNLFLYVFPVVGPTLIVFTIQGTTAEAYVSSPENRESRPHALNTSKKFLMIPKEWVIDCVECVESIHQITYRRVPNELNHQPTYMPSGLYLGKSLIRKSSRSIDNRVIYQDTNNSAEDLIESIPTLKTK